MLSEKLQTVAGVTSDVLGQFGIAAKHQPECYAPESIFSRHDVLVIIGLAKDLRGSVIYSMSCDTAKAIASSMMGGMPVACLDDLTKSAVCEFANMASGMSVSGFAGMFVDITPPTLVSGKNLAVTVGSDAILMTEIETACGGIDVYLGVE